jgi:hypothetical protein
MVELENKYRGNMSLEELLACADVLGEMSSNFAAMPSDNKKALEAGMHCLYAQSLVAEYASHISKGMEPFDAMEATVSGELAIPESKAVVLRLLTAKPQK